MQLQTISSNVTFPISVSDRHMIESVKRGLKRQDYLRCFSAEAHYTEMKVLLRKLSLYAAADTNLFTKDWQLRNLRNEVQQLCALLKGQVNRTRFK